MRTVSSAENESMTKMSSLTLRACSSVSAMMPALLNVRITTVHGSPVGAGSDGACSRPARPCALRCGEFKQSLLAEPDVEPVADVAVLEILGGGVAHERDVL